VCGGLFRLNKIKYLNKICGTSVVEKENKIPQNLLVVSDGYGIKERGHSLSTHSSRL
jgi:hypothetical protein